MLRIVHCRDAESANCEKSVYNPESITSQYFWCWLQNSNVYLHRSYTSLQFFLTFYLQILEFCVTSDKIQRLNTVEELMNAVVSTQKAALVCNGLARNSIAGHNDVTMDLCKLGEDLPRFTLHILDQPPAREKWIGIFATPEGRKKLLASTNYQRLVVLLHRDQEYKYLDAVKAELADSIKNVAPFGLTDPIPFLSLGSDVGKRETLVCASSKISGDFRVEVEGSSGKLFRRLIFLYNQSVIQSEALVKA
uniref:Uncharacterized protein n=1 Tax=Glossina pallidipes TaxID=7398 RepID=A0A1B0A525_GLOPL